MDSSRLGRLRLRESDDTPDPPPLVDRTGWQLTAGRCVLCSSREEKRKVGGEWEYRCGNVECDTRDDG